MAAAFVVLVVTGHGEPRILAAAHDGVAMLGTPSHPREMTSAPTALPSGWIQRPTQASPAARPMIASTAKAKMFPTSSTTSGLCRARLIALLRTAMPKAMPIATSNDVEPERIQ